MRTEPMRWIFTLSVTHRQLHTEDGTVFLGDGGEPRTRTDGGSRAQKKATNSTRLMSGKLPFVAAPEMTEVASLGAVLRMAVRRWKVFAEGKESILLWVMRSAVHILYSITPTSM